MPTHTAALLLGLCLVATASASGAASESLAPLTPEQRSLRILELEQRVRESREQLANLLSETKQPDTTPLRSQPILRTIAAELSETNAELRRLRAGVIARPLQPSRQ